MERPPHDLALLEDEQELGLHDRRAPGRVLQRANCKRVHDALPLWWYVARELKS